eukprot:5364869-Amphidinium_carterae.1
MLCAYHSKSSFPRGSRGSSSLSSPNSCKTCVQRKRDLRAYNGPTSRKMPQKRVDATSKPMLLLIHEGSKCQGIAWALDSLDFEVHKAETSAPSSSS